MKINANGITIDYDIDGPADAPTLTFSHSLCCQRAMWEGQIARLKNRFRCLSFDHRGHGGTSTPLGPYDFDMLADDADALLGALGIARTHWVGLSMGGMIGIGLALRHPHRLASLAACDTTAGFGAEYHRLAEGRIHTAEAHGMAPLVEPTIQRWFTPPFVAANPPLLDTVRQWIRDTPVAGYVGCNRALQTLHYTDGLAEIRVPTRVITGRHDPSTPVSAGEVIRSRITGADMVVIEEASHISNLEQPEAFNAALEGFLDGLPS